MGICGSLTPVLPHIIMMYSIVKHGAAREEVSTHRLQITAANSRLPCYNKYYYIVQVPLCCFCKSGNSWLIIM